MNPELMAAVYGAIGTGLGTGVTWIFNKKSHQAKAKAEIETAESLEIDNEIKLADYYKKLLDDLGNRYEDKYKSLADTYGRKEKVLEDEIKLLSNRNQSLQKENSALKKMNKELKEELQQWEQR